MPQLTQGQPGRWRRQRPTDAAPDAALILRNARPQGGPPLPKRRMPPIPKARGGQDQRDLPPIPEARLSGTSRDFDDLPRDVRAAAGEPDMF